MFHFSCALKWNEKRLSLVILTTINCLLRMLIIFLEFSLKLSPSGCCRRNSWEILKLRKVSCKQQQQVLEKIIQCDNDKWRCWHRKSDDYCKHKWLFHFCALPLGNFVTLKRVKFAYTKTISHGSNYIQHRQWQQHFWNMIPKLLSWHQNLLMVFVC